MTRGLIEDAEKTIAPPSTTGQDLDGDLHIRNHKRQSCHDQFNPEKVRKAVPEANLMCAEQTFAWQVLALDISFLHTSSFSYSIVDFV